MHEEPYDPRKRAEYAIQATLFISAPDAQIADQIAEMIAERVGEPYQYDLHDEHGNPQPVDVTLRIDSEPLPLEADK